LARREADINGVVSFHGGLDSPAPADSLKVKSKILICHAADDPLVKKAEIEAMQQFFDQLFKK
jgi:dienelactone hydrolase